MSEEQTKPWYASKTIWGGIAAVLSGIGMWAGVAIDTAGLTDMLAGAGATVGGLLAVIGRKVADSRIS